MKDMDAPAISVSHVRVTRPTDRGRLTVLDSVSFSIARGQTGVIVGPNGVGKSTMFAALIGSIEPDAGEIRILGRLPRDVRLGVVWQSASQSLYPWLSAIDNIALPLKIAGVDRRQRHHRAREICEQTGLVVPLDRPPYMLSGGEQQKVCILRALASGAEVLLLDEPLSNLAYDASLELLQHLQRIKASTDLTILLISHVPEHCIFMADVVVPFRSAPVHVDPPDIWPVVCEHAAPRPIDWMHDSRFQTQVAQVRHQVIES